MIRPANRPRGNSSSINTTSSSSSNQQTSISSTGNRPASARSPNAPTHIALPAQQSAQSFSLVSPSGFSRSRSRPSTPGSPGGHALGLGLSGGQSAPSNDYGFVGVGTSTTGSGVVPTSPGIGHSSGSPRQGFLSTLMGKTRPRGSTLSRSGGSKSMVPTMGSVIGFGGGASAGETLDGQAGAERVVEGSASRPVGGGNVVENATTSDPSDPLLPAQPTHRIRLVPHLESYRSLHFDPVVRDLVACPANREVGSSGSTGTVLKIGRFTDKTPQTVGTGRAVPPPAPVPVPAPVSQSTIGPSAGGEVPHPVPGENDTTDAPPTTTDNAGDVNPLAPVQPPTQPTDRPGAGGGGTLTSFKVAFRSKVVSRGHAEIWCEGEGKFFIKDTKSSSGTFLNHIRLSNPNQESRPFSIKDGDVIQLGVDYQGGTEEMYRCVKMKVEVGRERQRGQQNNFNKEAMKQLKALGGGVPEPPSQSISTPANGGKPTASVTDCCICLFSVTVQQALFIAPCSHVFHYKCIRPLLQAHHPGFSCPLCRSFHDLEADVEMEDAWEVASRRHSTLSRRESLAIIGSQPGSAVAVEDIPPVPPLHAAQDDTSRQSSGNEETAGDMDVDVDVTDTRFLTDDQHPGFDLRAEQATPMTEQQDPFAAAASLTSPNSPGSGTRPIMSLGSLPVPGVGGSHHSSDYASLDAATPMNTTFLSTLAEGGGLFGAPGGGTGMPLGQATGSGGRASLELVAEGDEAESLHRGVNGELAGRGIEGRDSVEPME